MRLRWPVAASLAPVGLLIGALIVGPPSSVPNDVRLVEASTTTTAPGDGTDGSTDGEQVDSAGPVPSVDPATTTTAADTTTTTGATTTTTSVVALDDAARAAVFVVVANATAVSGVAGDNEIILNDAGFTNTQTTDTSPPLPLTAIYFKPGFEAAAALVADALILPREIVQPYPDTTFTTFDDEADVIVLVGADRAG